MNYNLKEYILLFIYLLCQGSAIFLIGMNSYNEFDDSIIKEKVLTKELYKNKLLNYAIKNEIYINTKEIDSLYGLAEPKVQDYINNKKLKQE